MRTENQERLINESSDSPAETLADLPVTDEQARQTKAGGDDMPTEAVNFSFAPVRLQYQKKE